jgi:hypothetical protein
LLSSIIYFSADARGGAKVLKIVHKIEIPITEPVLAYTYDQMDTGKKKLSCGRMIFAISCSENLFARL